MLPRKESPHSSLHIFERPPLSITFNTSFEQKIGPVYAPNGPTLEFEVIGDRTNLIDLQNIFLEKNVGFSDLMVTNWNKMQVMLRQLVHHSLLILLYILFSRSAVLLRMASKFLLLIAITLKKLSLKEYFHTTRKQKKLGWNVRYILMRRNLMTLLKQLVVEEWAELVRGGGGLKTLCHVLR